MTAFIAYSHEPNTRRAAAKLASRLRDDGVNVWLDQWDLQPGEAWKPAIQKALNGASSVIAVVGRSDREKKWLKEEIAAALQQHKQIIPVLTNDATYEDIPESIRDRQAVAPADDRVAYLQLLRALGKDVPIPDNLDALPFWKKLRRYVAND